MRSLESQIKIEQRMEDGQHETDSRLNSRSLVDMVSYPYPVRSQEKPSGDDHPTQGGYEAAEEGFLMKIEPGILVKTLSGHIVKTEKEAAPGYWQCNDGRIHWGAAFRETSEAERTLYSASHSNRYSTDSKALDRED